MRIHLLLVLMGCLLLPLAGNGQQREGSDPADRPPVLTRRAQPASTLMVYSVRGGPADDLAKALLATFGRQQGFQVTANRQSQTLLIQAPEGLHDKLQTVLEKLDQPPRVIAVKAMVLQRTEAGEPLEDLAALSGPLDEVVASVRQWQQQGKVVVSDRFELTTLADQKAMIQVGQQTPVVTSVSMSRPGQQVRSYKSVSTGTILSVIGRVNSEGHVTLELQFEKSALQNAAPSDDDDGSGPDLSTVVTATHQTTVVVGADQATLVSGARLDTGGELLLVVGVQVLKPGETSQPVFLGAAPRPQRNQAPRSTTAGAPASRSLQALVGATFSRYDTNKDGLLQADEWAEMQTAPEGADKDGDKTLTREELQDWMGQRNRPGVADSFGGVSGFTSSPPADRAGSLRSRVQQYAKRLIEQRDTNGDGVLDKEEAERLSGPLAEADQNDDDKITLEEITDSLIKRSSAR